MDQIRHNQIPAAKTSEPFVEIEMGWLPLDAQCVAPVPPESAMTSPEQIPILAPDGAQALYFALRRIARENLAFETDHAKVFYLQAEYAKDFEDCYPSSKPLVSYYPYYQQMDYEQLRTYFTWRTKVREGVVCATSVSYAFVYIYELLHLIGALDPQDSLEKLMNFWEAYREFDTAIDRYLIPWMKDFHVYYPLDQSFREFVLERGDKLLYPSVFAYESGQQDSFELFAGISKYDIRKSSFYSEKTKIILSECFYFLLEKMRRLCSEKGFRPEDLIFSPLTRETFWIPFSRALFYPAAFTAQQDRMVILSVAEAYTCRNGRWTYQTVFLTENGRQLVGYLMKEMEAALRKKEGHKYALSANPALCDSKTRKILKDAGIRLPQWVREVVSEWDMLTKKTKVVINDSHLQRIRTEALSTQEKLTVEERLEDVRDRQPDPIPHPVPQTNSREGEPGRKISFEEMLTRTEKEALVLILRGEDIGAFALALKVMPEVLLDGINQKAMDCIGDTILMIDDKVSIYEEYQQCVMEMAGE